MTDRANRCGKCTLCCTVMKVVMEPPKPARTPCTHCSSAGCAIYADRPEPCQIFQCMWLWSQDKLGPMPAALRPDRCGVVLEGNSAGYIVAHSHRPAAWAHGPIAGWLLRGARHTRVLIENGESVRLLSPDGTTALLQFVGVDRETDERLYVIDGGELADVAARIVPGSAPGVPSQPLAGVRP